MEGTITALYRFTEKGKPGEALKEAYLIKNVGMEGDCHADGGEKQLTLLSGEARGWMQVQETPGLCFKRYKANLEIEGLAVSNLRPGMCLQAGTARLTVTECAKECFPGCQLRENGTPCRLLSGGIYLKVAESGTVKAGDPIFIL